MATIPQSNPKHLRVLGKNPFEGITQKTRLRQLLQTHQGRDKLFKVAQYLIRIKLWWGAIDFNSNYLPGEDFSRLERNLMTIVNTRRLFRVGRFFGELIRMRVTLIKCSELVYAPSSRMHWRTFFLQIQMLGDIIARACMCIKTVCEDVAFLTQKGFFHSNVAGQLIAIATKCGPPVLTIDLCLNTLRLYQGIVDASAPSIQDESSESFSLLTKYDRVDKLRRKMTQTAKEKSRPKESQTPGRPKKDEPKNVVYVSSYAKLIWTDFELHWICVTETKILLDIFVATANIRKWKGVQGPVSIAGLLSGFCSVYRVWTYGR